MAREVYTTGPHFRAADLETADRSAALLAKAATPRSLLVGAAFVMAISLATPYIEEYLDGTLVASNHLPVSALVVLVFLALALNVGLVLHRLPFLGRAGFIGAYVLGYWGFWAWYQVERARAIIPGSEGEELAWPAYGLALLGFFAGLLFFLSGALAQDAVRRKACAVASAGCIGGMILLLAFFSGGAFQPVSAQQVEVLVVLLFLSVCAVSVLLLAAGGPLDRAESMVVLAMCMVSAAIPNIGLMGYLIPVMSAPHFYANPENGWAERLHQHIAGWLCPQDVPEKGFYPIRWLYDGIGGKPIPWAAWVKPLFFWSIFTFFIYGLMFFLSALLRRQWADKERLPFPLAQVPLVMSEGYKPGDVLMPFFRDRVVWIGIAIPFLVHSYNSLHDFFSGIPQIPLRFTEIDRKYLSEPPWSALRPVWVIIYPSVIGITYLISLEVAFSLWFFYFVTKLMVFIAVQAGYGTSAWDYEGGAGWRSMLVNQGYGGMIAMVLLGAYLARAHLWEVARKALSPLLPARDVDDSTEPVGYRLSFWGFWACFFGAAIWLYVAGMTPAVILFLLVVFVITIIGLSRLVAEGGLFYVQSAATCPQDMLEAAVGTAPLGAKNLTVGAFIHGIYMFDLRSMVMPGIVHAFKVAGEGGVKRRQMAMAVALALMVGVLYSYVSFLHISYRVGGNRLSHWFYRMWPVAPFEHANTSLKRDMSRLTASCRSVIAETKALMDEKPWVADAAQRAGTTAAIEELEGSLKDVETSMQLRSRLSSLTDTLRNLSHRFGLERLKESLRNAEVEGRTPRVLYTIRRSANFIATVDYPRQRLPEKLLDIEAVVARWGQGGFRSAGELYELEAELKRLADMLSAIAALPLQRDATPVASKIRSLAAEADREDSFLALKTSVAELITSWHIDRGADLLTGPVSLALARHEDAVPLRSLRDKTLQVLKKAAGVYSDSAFVAARPAVVSVPEGERIIVPSGDGTVISLEPESGEVVFKRRLGDVALSEPAITDIDANNRPEILLVGRHGSVSLLDASRGRFVWSRKFSDAISASAGPVNWASRIPGQEDRLEQECVFLGTKTGQVLVVALRGAKRVAELKVAAGGQKQPPGPVSAIASTGAIVYAGFQGSIAAFSDDQTLLGMIPFSTLVTPQGPVSTAAAQDTPIAIIPADDGGVLAVARNGLVVGWQPGGYIRAIELGKEVVSAFSLAGNCLILHRDGISVVEIRTGTLTRSERLPAAAVSGAVVAEALHVALEDGSVLRWTPQGLEKLASAPLKPAGAPVVLNGATGPLILLPDIHGSLYALEPGGATRWRFATPGRKEAEVYWYAGNWVRWAWSAVGAAVFWAFTMLRQRIMWWPHPIGYVFMMSNHAFRKLWFSILVGWFLKFAILKYLGFKMYYRMRSFFVGIVVGEVLAGGLWVFIDFITRTQKGWPIHIN